LSLPLPEQVKKGIHIPLGPKKLWLCENHGSQDDNIMVVAQPLREALELLLPLFDIFTENAREQAHMVPMILHTLAQFVVVVDIGLLRGFG
jgi:hypothetical protein